MKLVLGNRTAIESHDDGETFVALPKGKRATYVEFPPDYTPIQAATDLLHPQGVWASHAKSDTKPAWVASDNPLLAALIADAFGEVVEKDGELVREPIEVRDLELDSDADTTTNQKG